MGSPIPGSAEEAAALLTPLEEAILAMLPKDGMKLGYAWLAPSVSDIRERLNQGLQHEVHCTSTQVAGAVKRLMFRGLIIPKPLGSSRNVGYQRVASSANGAATEATEATEGEGG